MIVSLASITTNEKLCESTLSKLGFSYVKEDVLFDHFKYPDLAVLDSSSLESLQRLRRARDQGDLFPAIFIVGPDCEDLVSRVLIYDRFLFAPFNENVFARAVHGALRSNRTVENRNNSMSCEGGIYPQLVQVNRLLDSILGTLRNG